MFYGKSITFGGDKKIVYSNASTLGNLCLTQALADYATLIIDLKNNLSTTDSLVMVFKDFKLEIRFYLFNMVSSLIKKGDNSNKIFPFKKKIR